MARFKWTFEMLKAEALKYKTRGEFKKNSVKAYQTARNRGIFDEICSHMPKRVDPPNLKWTFDALIEEALKYKTRGEFQKNNRSAYGIALRRKDYQLIVAHMPEHIDTSNENSVHFKWTDEMLRQEALKFTTRSAFARSSPAYQAAQARNILDEICSHMPKHVDQSGENNPAFKYTDEMLREEALKYKFRGEFQKNNQSVYKTAFERGILDQISSHMNKSKIVSFAEKSLFDQIKLLYPKTQTFRDRKIKIKNKPHIQGFDLDIYVPELRKAIEFDGAYWHSDAGLKRSRSHWPQEDIDNYHQIKDSYFLSKGIQILHIKEEDWIKDKEECIQKCLDFLGHKKMKAVA